MPSVSDSDSGSGLEDSLYGSGTYGSGAYAESSSVGFGSSDAGFGSSTSLILISDYDYGTGTDCNTSLWVTSTDAGSSTDTGTWFSSSDKGTGLDSGSTSGIISDSGSGNVSDTGVVRIKLLQSRKSNSGASSVLSKTMTLGSGVTQGNLLIASVMYGGNTSYIYPPSSDWKLAVTDKPAGLNATITTSIYYAVVTPAMAVQTSWTFIIGASFTMAVVMSEFWSYTGWIPSPLDKTARGNTQAIPAVSSGIDSGTTPFTKSKAELWVVCLGYKGAGQAYSLISPGFAIVQDSPGGSNSLTELYRAQSNTGSADCRYRLSGSPAYWAGCAATFMLSITSSVFSKDSGAGHDSHSAVLLISDSDSGTGLDEPDAGAAYGVGLYNNGLYNIGLYAGPAVIVQTFISDSDSAIGLDTQAGPSVVNLPVEYDCAVSSDAGSVSQATSSSDDYSLSLLLQYVAPSYRDRVFEGFSLSRVAVLGSDGTESNQLYAAQSISIEPAITSSNMKADDYDIGVWFSMNKASITVINGFMSWGTISALSGLAVTTGGNWIDYYGLPLWTQYQHNRPAVPMAFRMTARSGNFAVRTLDFILYRVQLSVIDYTGTAYKQGLGVSYAGTVMFSSVDEAGNALSSPQIGRIVSSPGTLTGVIGHAQV